MKTYVSTEGEVVPCGPSGYVPPAALRFDRRLRRLAERKRTEGNCYASVGSPQVAGACYPVGRKTATKGRRPLQRTRGR